MTNTPIPCTQKESSLVHPYYAISWRNNWMLRQAEHFVTYITRGWGGAARNAEEAERLKKVIINLYELM